MPSTSCSGRSGAHPVSRVCVPSTPDNAASVIDFVQGCLEALDASPRALVELGIATDEVFANIARYAYDEGAGGTAEVEVAFDEGERVVTLTFSDEGVPFDPTGVADPDLATPAEERAPGGYGISLVRKAADALRYERVGERNVLVLEKRI